MDNQNRNYTFDEDSNEDNEIVEYLERDLGEDMASQKQPEKKRRKSINNKALKFYEQNKMKVLWSALGVLVVILIIALIVTNTGRGDTSEKPSEPGNKAEEASKDESTTKDGTDKESEFLAEPSDSAYNSLFEKFFRNTYVEWNETAVAECYESMQNVADTNYTYLNKYIEAVQDIVCYVGYETEDGKKLVYVTYNMKFKNIETLAPMMEAYMLVETDGQYKIHNFQVGEELDLYTNAVQDNPNYQQLKSNINNQRDTALESDADLKKVYSALQEMGSEGK